uniref:Sulfhydryl oxidase n=1 Tax=Tetraselmis sp. GSL018 TaxID=582737 RepID=A0A061S7X1_9CHLO
MHLVWWSVLGIGVSILAFLTGSCESLENEVSWTHNLQRTDLEPGSWQRRRLSAGGVGGEKAKYPVDLNHENFSKIISELDHQDVALLELYATWCPACRHFKPAYEKVGGFFDARVSSHGKKVFVARIDCANQANMKRVCDSFNIAGFPTVLFGTRQDFEQHHGEPVPGWSAEAIIRWVTSKTKTEYVEAAGDAQSGPEVTGEPPAPHDSAGARPPAEIAWTKSADLADIEAATVQGFDYIIASQTLLRQEGARRALHGWVRMLAATHPVSTCRRGSQQLALKFDEVWPDGSEVPAAALGRFRVCGRGGGIQPWRSCKGSRPDTRGYTCGVWSLLHATAAILPEDGGRAWMEAVTGYIGNFFQCAECSRHFLIRTKKQDSLDVATRRDAVLWLWRVHNEVNMRLEKVEREHGTGDPAMPKVQWPPAEVCADCRRKATDEWDEDRLYDFLLRFYGGPPPDKAPAIDKHLAAILEPMPSPPTRSTMQAKRAARRPLRNLRQQSPPRGRALSAAPPAAWS